MMLYQKVDGGYLGLYREYGGPVIITEYSNGEPVYSYDGLVDKYRIITLLRYQSDTPRGDHVGETVLVRITGTEELITFDMHFLGVATEVGPNRYSVREKKL